MYVYIYLCMNVCKYACIYVFYMHECVYYVCMQSCVDTSEGYTYGYLHIVCVCVFLHSEYVSYWKINWIRNMRW